MTGSTVTETIEHLPVYVFRHGGFARNQDTVVSAAPRDAVAATFGGGGMQDINGLSNRFGGGCFFRNDEDRTEFLGVWGSRKASRFRSDLRRRGYALKIIRTPPPARLIFWGSR